MPRYRPESPLGYDLELELPFFEAEDGTRYQLGSAGSFIHICPTCGEEHMRVHSTPNHCFQGHGTMDLLKLGLSKDYPLPNGCSYTTVEERRETRLKEEAARPWNWVFGARSEADFPDGFAEVDGKKVA